MDDFDWKETLGKVAPVIATAIGGPMTGVAVKMATEALGIDGGVSELRAAVASGDPTVLVKLKQVDADFKRQMKELDVRLVEADVRDRGSARVMAEKRGIIVQTVLSAIIGFTFAYVLFAIFNGTVHIAEGMRDIAIYALGTLNTILVQVFNFWFGSSSGSKEKNALLVKKEGAENNGIRPD